MRRYGVGVVGLDQSPQMLAAARGAARARARARARASRSSRARPSALPFADGEFDHLTFTYLLRYVDDPAATLRELARVVRPGGRIASLEFGVPEREPWRALWRAYTRVGLPLLGRADLRASGRRSGASSRASIPDFYARHPLASAARAVARRRASAAVEVRPMSFGAGVVIWGSREGARRDPR